jgi:uncharacterized protein
VTMLRRSFPSKLRFTLLVVAIIVSGCSRYVMTREDFYGDSVPRVLKMADVRQATSYTCGVACAQAILDYYGIDEREDRLAAQFGATEEGGTSPSQLLAGFASYGLAATLKEQTTLDDLRANVEQKIPTMVAIQAWLEKYPPPDWSQHWEDGHWLIVIGLDERNIYFEDPSLLGARGWLTHAEFLARWHDYVGEPPCCDEKDRVFRQVSISVRGHLVKVPAYKHID